jgi:hypothetical protein
MVRLQSANTPFYHDFSDLSITGHLREDFILQHCRSQSVVHFGFLDAPFLAEKVQRGDLLHDRMRSVSSVLFGFDIDGASLDEYRRITGDTANALWDVQQPLPDPARQALDAALPEGFDLIVFSEVLEHIINPGLALANLADLCTRYHCRLLVTVPNAFSVVGFTNALHGIESVHPDHYHYYSPYTLHRILSDSGFQNIQVWLYGSQDTLASPGLTKNGVLALADPPVAPRP